MLCVSFSMNNVTNQFFNKKNNDQYTKNASYMFINRICELFVTK